MAIATITLTGNIHDRAGSPHVDARRTKVWLTARDANGTIDRIVDPASNEERYGDAKAEVQEDGSYTFTDLWPTNAASNPTGYYYELHIDYALRHPRHGPHGRSGGRDGRSVWSSGPFSLTASANAADLDLDTPAVSATWRSAFRNEMAAEVEAAEAARDAAEALVISDLGTTDGQTRALIEAGASQTAQALESMIVTSTRGRPSGVPTTHTGLWDPARALYNAEPRRLRRSRGKLMESRVPGKPFFEVLCIGDSITAGTGTAAPRNLSSWPAQFQAALVGAGFHLGGDEWVTPNAFEQVAAERPTQWVRNGTWNWFAGGGYLGSFLASQTVGNTLVFTSTVPGDVIEFSYLANNPQFSYQVDGGTWFTAGGEGGNSIYTKKTITGRPIGTTHTLTIRVDSSATPTHIGPARAYNTVTSGIMVGNFAVGGSTSDTWLGSASPHYNGPSTRAINPAPDLVVVEPMIFNDMAKSPTPISAATHKANIKSIIATYSGLASAPDTLLVVPAPPSTAWWGQPGYNAYRQTTYQIADELGIPLVDLGERFGAQVDAAAAGYYSDSMHLSAAGYGDAGRTIAAALTGF